MIRRDPFKLKIGKPISADWNSRKFLSFDESSVDPRFVQDQLDQEKVAVSTRPFYLLLTFVIAVFFARLIYLQVIENDKYLSTAEGNRLRIQYIFAPRGFITDRYGKNLVTNIPSFELVMTPLDLPKEQAELESVLVTAASFFGVDISYLKSIAESAPKNSFSPVTVKQNVEKETALVYLSKAKTISGFSVQNNPLRNYENGPIFSQILGYTGKLNKTEYDELKFKGYQYNDEIGKEGLEVQYENYLRGVLGEKIVEVDAKGSVINTFEEKDPLAGSKLVLNIDADLQKKLYDSLNKIILQRGARRAAAIALDPATGGLLALVSLPSYNNNLFSGGISSQEYAKLVADPNFPLFNRAISGAYPPGSTIKPFLAAAALQEGAVDQNTKINDTGKLFVPNEFNPDIFHIFRGWNPNGLGLMNIYTAIAMSSDIYFYTIGGGNESLGIKGLGPLTMSAYLKKFAFGDMTGIDLPSEKAGLVPDPTWKEDRFAGDKIAEKWYLGDTYNMSIGQGFLLATPLQVAVATAAIASNGRVLRPQLLKKVLSREDQIVYEMQPQILSSDFIEPEYLSIVRDGMRRTVTDGTARSLSALPITIAGKTGTSQFEGGDLSKTHAWFTAFAPFENPKIALTIIIEAGGEGSGAAVPVASEVLSWYSQNR